MKKRKIRTLISDRIFSVANAIILVLFAFTCLYPFLYTASVSLSINEAVMSGNVYLFPVGLDFDAYNAVFTDAAMLHSLWFTIYLTVIYTVVALIMSILCAYPLSKKRLRGRSAFTMVVAITMYFSGGMIPSYLLVSGLGLINSMWALILPCALNTFNMIIMKSFFTSIPDGLEEAATIDGANDWIILTRIYLPLSMPIIATLALFYAVQRWNGFQDALFYINRAEMFPLQLKLRQLISLNILDEFMNNAEEQSKTLIPETLKAASLMFATIPILIVYPWLQKYFVKGVMVGSVKG